MSFVLNKSLRTGLNLGQTMLGGKLSPHFSDLVASGLGIKNKNSMARFAVNIASVVMFENALKKITDPLIDRQLGKEETVAKPMTQAGKNFNTAVNVAGTLLPWVLLNDTILGAVPKSAFACLVAGGVASGLYVNRKEQEEQKRQALNERSFSDKSDIFSTILPSRIAFPSPQPAVTVQ